MYEITGDIIKHCYSKASYVVLMSFCISFTYESVNTAKKSAMEGLVCSWTRHALPYYHLVAVAEKVVCFYLHWSYHVTECNHRCATTDVVLNNWFPSSEVFHQISSLLCEKVILIYSKEMCTDFKPNARWEFWLRSEKCAQMSSIIMPWS